MPCPWCKGEAKGFCSEEHLYLAAQHLKNFPPEVRELRLSRIKAAINDGTYEMPSNMAIAEAMLYRGMFRKTRVDFLGKMANKVERVEWTLDPEWLRGKSSLGH